MALQYPLLNRESNTNSHQVGIVSNRQSASNYNDDIKCAQYIGIDAFALNISTDSYIDEQLGFTYQSAANNGIKVFISFNFNQQQTSQGNTVGTKIAQYTNLPTQLKVNRKVFVSSFASNSIDIVAIRVATDSDIYFIPNFHPSRGDFSNLQATLNWIAQGNNGNNRSSTPSKQLAITDSNNTYNIALNGKPYIAYKWLE